MTELRWILLGVGVLIIAGVYFLRGRRLRMPSFGREKKSDVEAQSRREPRLADDSSAEAFGRLIGAESQAPAAPVVTSDQPADSPERPASAEAEAAQGPQKIVVLHVAARGSQRFAGEDVVSVLQAEGLQHGRFDIFHWQSGAAEPVFSVASMVEPGSFDLANIANITTPGLSLFLVLPGPEDAAESFSQMLITARNLAQKLGGEVLDEQGSSLSNQTAGHIREEILAFQLRLRALEDMHA